MNITDISPSIKPTSVAVHTGAEGEELTIDWEDGHATRYPLKVTFIASHIVLCIVGRAFSFRVWEIDPV